MIKSADRVFPLLHNYLTPKTSECLFTSQALSLSNSLESLKLFSCSKFSDSDFDLISKIKSLRSLHLEDTTITEKGIKSLASLSNLTYLGLRHFPDSLQNIVSCIADCFPKLQHVALSHLERKGFQTQWCQDLSKIVNLRSLKLGHVNDDDLKLIASNTKLTKLSLQEPNLSNAGLACLSHLPFLSSFTLQFNSNDNTNEDDYQVLENLTNLTYLNISSNYNKITNVTIEIIAIHLSALTILNVSRTRIKDEGLFAIAKHLTGLQELDISDTHTTDVGIIALAGSLKRLSVLNMTSNNGCDCPKVTIKALRELKKLEMLKNLLMGGSKSCSYEAHVLKDISSLRKLEIYSYKPFNNRTKKNLMDLQRSRGDIEIIVTITGGEWIHLPLIFDIPYQILK